MNTTEKQLLRKIRLLVLFFIVALVLSGITAFPLITTVPQKEMKELFLWKSDSCGCQRLRTREMSEYIINSLKIENISEEDFIKYFGNPNKKIERNDNIFLIYYFDAVCDIDNNFIDSNDYCEASYIFYKNKLIERMYICI